MYLLLTLFVFLSQILLARSQTLDPLKIQMNISVNDENVSVCNVKGKYAVSDGTSIQFVIHSKSYINYAWRTFVNRYNNSIRFSTNLQTVKDSSDIYLEPFQIQPLYDGVWTFKIYNHKNSLIQPTQTYENDTYTATYCIIDITVTPYSGVKKWDNMSNTEKYMYLGGGIVSLIIFVVIIQTSIIMYYKSKAQVAKIHQNLSSARRKSDDKVRYSVGFSRKSRSRDSGLYETLEDVSLQRTSPPVPPGIETLPKKTDFNDETLRIRDRPQCPLPLEEYEEIGRGENYEPTPVDEHSYEPPPKFPMAKSKCKFGAKKPTPSPPCLLQSDVTSSPTRTCKRPAPEKGAGMNPLAAELNSLIHRRNTGNSVSSPSEPSKSSLPKSKKTLPKPKAKSPIPETDSNSSDTFFFDKQLPPPPVTASTVRAQATSAVPRPNPTALRKAPTAPTPQLIHPAQSIHVSTHNDEPNSSDEEWLYEPLPEIKLKKPPPRPDDSQGPTHVNRNSSDEEWTYEPIQQIKFK